MSRRSVPFVVLALAVLGVAVLWLARPPAQPVPGDSTFVPDGPPGRPGLDGPPVENGLPAWEPFLAAVREGRDPRAFHFLRWLEDGATEEERRGALEASLEVWFQEAVPGLLPVLRAHTGAVARILVPFLETETETETGPALELAGRLFFLGGERDPAAWSCEELRQAVVALCRRSGDPERDVETGPHRARALWIAGRAQLVEAKRAILMAAGRARDEEGRQLPADPHGSAVAMARRIIEEHRRPRRGR